MSGSQLPIQHAPAQYDQATVDAILRVIEQRLHAVETVKAIGYQMTNVTTTKVFNAASGDLAATRNLLATLIQELIAAGVLSAS
jgi:hypothetical protein